MQILGESVKGVDLQQLNRELDGFTQRAGPNAAAFTAAAEAQRSLSQNLANLTTALTNVLEPLNKIVSSVNLSVATFERLIKILAALGAAFLIFTRILPAVQGATNAFALLGTVGGVVGKEFAKAGGAFVRAGKHLLRMVGILPTAYGGLMSLGFALSQLGKGLLRLTGIGAVIFAVAQGINLLVKSVTGFDALGALGDVVASGWDKAKKALGLYNEEAGNYTRGKAQLEDFQARSKAADDLKNRIVIVNAEEQKGINNSIRAMQVANGEMVRRIDLQTGLLRANEETRFAVETTQQAEQNYLKAIEPILAKIQAIRDQGSKASETDIALMVTLQEGIVRISKEYEAQVPAINKVINARIQEMQVAKEIEILNARLTKQAQDRAAVESSVRDIILGGQQRINDAYNEAALVGLPAIQAQLRKIAQEEERTAQAARRRVAEQMGDDTTGLDQAIARINAAAAVITERRQQAAQQIYDEQNSFTAGWARAFSEYAATATTAATQAKNIFSTVTKGIEDSFVNFAKTGKLSVKDLFKSIAETILRSQVQQLLARTFGGGGGGGSFLGNLFSAFVGSRSAGGPVSAGRAYRVGESGPETFVPTGGGTIVPGGGATSVTYNITATDAASFQALIARDPEFLFAVTEQGRRRMPNNRR
jgi:lambda family phage tail tape measure protein